MKSSFFNVYYHHPSHRDGSPLNKKNSQTRLCSMTIVQGRRRTGQQSGKFSFFNKVKVKGGE
jgi:hypothetical protein